MFLTVDRHSGIPVFRQLEQQVRLLIAAGRLRAGDELPSTRALAEELGLNPMTVSKVYALLEREGVLERRPGLALVVAAQVEERLAAERRAQLERRLAPLVGVVRQLGLSNAEALATFQRLLEVQHDSTEEEP